MASRQVTAAESVSGPSGWLAGMANEAAAVALPPGPSETGTPVTVPVPPPATLSATASPLAAAPPLLLSASGYEAVVPASAVAGPLLTIFTMGRCSIVGVELAGGALTGP